MSTENSSGRYTNSREFGDGPACKLGRTRKDLVYPNQIPIGEWKEPIVPRKVLQKPIEHDENPEEQTRRIVEESKKIKPLLPPVDGEWVDFNHKISISSKNIEATRKQIKKLGNLSSQIKDFDNDEELIEKLVAFQKGTPLYNLSNKDPINVTDIILALPIKTENIYQTYMYVGNVDNGGRENNSFTKYKTPKGKHFWNTWKTGNLFSTTNNVAVCLEKSVSGRSSISRRY